MPLTRIDLPASINADRRHALADAVHQAAVDTIGITPDNRHQTIQVHDHTTLHVHESFLGIQRDGEVVVISITLRRARTDEAKGNLFARIAELAERDAGIHPANITVSLTENDAADWSFGNGRAQLLETEDAPSTTT
jgi:phenylpyruvate tautomerase PptA (4-oxalocrotonate tautomerase family)